MKEVPTRGIGVPLGELDARDSFQSLTLSSSTHRWNKQTLRFQNPTTLTNVQAPNHIAAVFLESVNTAQELDIHFTLILKF